MSAKFSAISSYLIHMYEQFCGINNHFTELLVLLWLKKMNLSSKTALEFSKKYLSNYKKSEKNVMAISYIDEFIVYYTIQNISIEKQSVDFFSVKLTLLSGKYFFDLLLNRKLAVLVILTIIKHRLLLLVLINKTTA